MTIRVLVVDDSVFYQHRLQALLNSEPSIQVVGLAGNGVQAIEKTLALKPDVITMDVEMPIMDGISAVRRIMHECPTPVLMISAMTKQGARATFDALDAGALDFLTKDFHHMTERGDQATQEIRNKVISVAQKGKRVSAHSRPPIRASQKQNVSTSLANYSILALGASTGGPVAVQQVLKNLPQEFPLPVLVVQHMPGTFTPMFSERMNQMCQITVRQAENGDLLFPGCAYIAPGGKQMKVRKKGREVKIEITDGDPSDCYRPSVDVTYQSLAEVFPGKVLAVILTGMGSDGCEGARRLKQSGSVVWAQDEQSSVVYGMPMAVAKAGLADQIMSLDKIGSTLGRGF